MKLRRDNYTCQELKPRYNKGDIDLICAEKICGANDNQVFKGRTENSWVDPSVYETVVDPLVDGKTPQFPASPLADLVQRNRFLPATPEAIHGRVAQVQLDLGN